jgi:hypothetical protein
MIQLFSLVCQEQKTTLSADPKKANWRWRTRGWTNENTVSTLKVVVQSREPIEETSLTFFRAKKGYTRKCHF